MPQNVKETCVNGGLPVNLFLFCHPSRPDHDALHRLPVMSSSPSVIDNNTTFFPLAVPSRLLLVAPFPLPGPWRRRGRNTSLPPPPPSSSPPRRKLGLVNILTTRESSEELHSAENFHALIVGSAHLVRAEHPTYERKRRRPEESLIQTSSRRCLTQSVRCGAPGEQP